VASFVCSDAPTFVDICTLAAAQQQEEEAAAAAAAIIAVVTSKGHLILFQHYFQSKNKKKTKSKAPIKSWKRIQIESDSGSPLKILAAFFYSFQDQESILIIYGSSLSPTIEKINMSDLKSSNDKDVIILIRLDPDQTSVALQREVNKIETPLVAKELKVFAPAAAAAVASKRKSTEPTQMSLEERLNVMGIDNENENDNENDNVYLMKNGQMPKTDNLLVLLVQGLQSNDAKMLNHVLQHKNEKVVSKTVRMLPTNYVIILVKELNKRLQGHAQSGMGLIKWLKCLLMSHTSFLMSYPDLIDSLGSVYEMMSARTKLFPQLAKLQGKLQLVMSQVSSQTESLQTSNVHNNNNNNVQPTLLFYQDSTSEDEQIEDELIPSHSEFEDYVFSDEEEEEEEDSTSEEEEEDDEEATIIKKDIVNFKKKKQNQTIKTKKNKSKLDKEEEEEEEESDEEMDSDQDSD
jgi:U3 small nucleolar RNA-associated protein 5